LFEDFLRLHSALACVVTPAAEAQTLLEACVGRALDLAAHDPPMAETANRSPGLRSARDLIRARSATKVSLQEIAAAAGLSPSYTVRAFAKAFGLPPHQFQVQVRLARGRGLLAAGLPPKAVAGEVGFGGVEQFSRAMTRFCGIAPACYARAVAARPSSSHEPQFSSKNRR
jgi:AraC-like DNA-binding protein